MQDNTQQKRTQLKEPQSKLNVIKANNNKSSIQTQQKQQPLLSDADSRITTYLQTVSNLQQNTQRMQAKLEHFKSLQQWINTFIDQSALNKGTSSGSSFMSLSSKLNVLQRQAIVSQTENNKISKINDDQNQQKQLGQQNLKCNISSHLNYLLRPKADNKERIRELVKNKKDLLTRIEQTLMKQEPYLHEKIMKKILKQLKRQSKSTAMMKINELCKQKQKWLKQTKQSINSEIQQKQIQSKVGGNLMKMKEIMNKKIMNEQFQSEICKDQTNIEKNITKFKKNVQDIKERLKNQIAKTKQSNVQQQLQKIEKQRHNKSTNIEFDGIFIGELKSMIEETEQILAKPIGSKNTPQLLQECERLTEQINQMTASTGKKR